MSAGPITELVLQTEAILRLAVKAKLPIKSADVVSATGLDGGSARRDLRRMAEAGLLSIDGEGARGVVYYVPTAEAHDAIEALDRAAGQGPVTGVPVWPLDAIAFNPDNPRKKVSGDFIDGLADTIVEAGGLLQAIILYPADANGARMLHAGEQRVRACRQLVEEGRLPASLAEGLPFTERQATRAEALFVGLVENGQREGLSPWEDAKALRAYADETGLSARAIAFKIGRAREGSEKGVGDVQQKIKTARKATAANIALHESGVWTWERLRESTQEAKEAATPAAPAEPEQVELVEAVAAATPTEEIDPDLVVAVLEIAHRAHVHPGKASPLGPTTKVTHPINPMANREEHPVAVGLVAGGYALFDTSHPYQVVLLRPGVELARRFAETPEELPDAIRTALREAGIAEEDIDDMEREGECQTAWLNEEPDAPPPEVSDALTLVLFEIYDSWKRQPGNEYYGDQPRHYGAPLRLEAREAEEIKALQSADLLGRFSCWRKDGLLRIRPQFASNTEKLLRRLCTDLEKAGERSKALHELRAKVCGTLEAEADRRSRVYATPWLNGPFEPTDEGKAAMEADAIAAKRSAELASQRATEAAEREAQVAVLEAEASKLSWDDLRDRVQALLEARGQGGPFFPPPNDWNFATLGSGSVADGRSVAARMARLALAALTDCWPKSDLDDDREATDWVEYQEWIVANLISEHSVPPMRAPAYADKVRERLQAEDPDDLDFTRAGARDAAEAWAEDHLEDGQLIEPEQSQTEEEQADAAVA